jgi:hypothetical protein
MFLVKVRDIVKIASAQMSALFYPSWKKTFVFAFSRFRENLSSLFVKIACENLQNNKYFLRNADLITKML